MIKFLKCDCLDLIYHICTHGDAASVVIESPDGLESCVIKAASSEKTEELCATLEGLLEFMKEVKGMSRS